jgi:gas vesicle protein
MADEHGGDAAGYLGWFFLGAIAGAATALLLTPKTGSETRELLTEHSQELFKKAQEKASEAQDMAGDLLGKGREYIEEQRNRLAGAFEAGRSAMKEEMGKLRSDGT